MPEPGRGWSAGSSGRRRQLRLRRRKPRRMLRRRKKRATGSPRYHSPPWRSFPPSPRSLQLTSGRRTFRKRVSLKRKQIIFTMPPRHRFRRSRVQRNGFQELLQQKRSLGQPCCPTPSNAPGQAVRMLLPPRARLLALRTGGTKRMRTGFPRPSHLQDFRRVIPATGCSRL